MAKEYFKSIFTGFIAGNIIAMIFNQWIFLEMRVNIALVIPLSTFIVLIVYHFSRIKFHLTVIFFLELIFGLLVFLLYNFSVESYRIIPASMFREGFHLNSLSLGEVNAVILLIFVIANFIIFRDSGIVSTWFVRQPDES
ncbi:MAG TPA: hypothetical protein PKG60_00610 [Spirochaetota bacterium]|nr:hypothetical protein [Spirochaetota bacterium]HPS86147.1 hypothetical protein [Spirochaetota bacterium]